MAIRDRATTIGIVPASFVLILFPKYLNQGETKKDAPREG